MNKQTNMTLAQIRAMLQVGSVWRFNVDRSALHSPNADEIRTIEKVQTSEFVAKQADGKCKSIWTPFPKASQVIEARDGYLKFADDGLVVEMTRQV